MTTPSLAIPKFATIVNLFNDHIFPKDGNSTDVFNDAEEALYALVCEQIGDQDKLSKYIPSPPGQLMLLLKELEEENTDFNKLKDIIMEDIGLLAAIIRVSNSPLYRPRVGEIESIEKAISMIGLQGVMQIASQLMLRRIVDIRSSRYKSFGEKLWNHCLKSAEACRVVGEPDAAFTNYLLGLLHDIGRVAILGCVVDLLKTNDDESIDELKVIKRVSIEQGPWLSAIIAKEWNMPEFYVESLDAYDRLFTSMLFERPCEIELPGTQCLQWGSQSSQIHSFIENKSMEEDVGIGFLQEIGLTNSKIGTLFANFALVNLS